MTAFHYFLFFIFLFFLYIFTSLLSRVPGMFETEPQGSLKNLIGFIMKSFD